MCCRIGWETPFHSQLSIDSGSKSVYQSKAFPFSERTNCFTKRPPWVPAFSQVSTKWVMCCLGFLAIKLQELRRLIPIWHSLVINAFCIGFGIYGRTCRRTSILCPNGICNHILQLLDIYQGHWGGMFVLRSAFTSFSFITPRVFSFEGKARWVLRAKTWFTRILHLQLVH